MMSQPDIWALFNTSSLNKPCHGTIHEPVQPIFKSANLHFINSYKKIGVELEERKVGGYWHQIK